MADKFYLEYLEDTDGKIQDVCLECGEDHEYIVWLELKIAAQNTIHNCDYEDTLKVLAVWDEIGDEINLATYCEKRINSAKPNFT